MDHRREETLLPCDLGDESHSQLLISEQPFIRIFSRMSNDESQDDDKGFEDDCLSNRQDELQKDAQIFEEGKDSVRESTTQRGGFQD